MSRLAPRWRAFFSAPTGGLAAVMALALVAVAVLGPSLASDRATAIDTTAAGQSPSGSHLLGTDGLGRDILARTVSGARLSLELGVLATLVTAVLGLALGLLVANLSGRPQRALAAVLDALMGFPVILLAVFVVIIVGVGVTGAVLAVGIAYVPAYARLTHTLATGVLAREYVDAARVVGVRRWRLQRRYVLPNVSGGLTVALLAQLTEAIVAIAGLSFLGLGVQSPDFDWGRMLTDGIHSFYVNPAAALAPTVAIVLVGVTGSLLADATARALDPLLWTATARDGDVPPLLEEGVPA